MIGPDLRSTLALIQASALRSPGERAVIFQIDALEPAACLTLDYQEFLDQIVRAASLLRRAGVGRNSTVAILAPNIPSAHVALYAAELAGIAFPINYLLGAAHVAELLDAANVDVAIVLCKTEELSIWQTMQEALHLCHRSILVYEIDANEADPHSRSLQALLASEQPRLELFDELNPDTTAALFHTGGTTAAPKILRHIHANQVHVAKNAPRYYGLHEGDVMLNGFPLFHVAGAFVYGLSAFAVGATLYIPTLLGFRNPRFVSRAWELLEYHRVTHLGCVPTMMTALLQNLPASLDHTKPSATLGSRVRARQLLTGGSPLPPLLADEFEARTGIPVRNIFGMTECAGVVSVEPFDAPRVAGSVGVALASSEVRAIRLGDLPDGPLEEFCEPNEIGILCLRGPHVSPGYLDSTRDFGTFTPDGWLVSGDLGYVDPSERIFLTGRAKDLIIRSGHNLDPQAIEEAFLTHEAVAVCAAVGRRDAYAGEIPVVFVTLKPGFDVSGEDILAEVKSRISEPPAVPRAVIVIPTMPLTAVGKIHKPTLRDMANAGLVKAP
jgi:fatty-acyl-CoA synthase